MTTHDPIRKTIAWRSLAATALALAWLALPVLAADAGANPFLPDHPWIYQTPAVGSDPTVDPPVDGFIKILPENGTETLRLFITVDGPGETPNFGSNGGTPCVVGAGGLDSDHICAFTANFEIQGDAQFVSWTPIMAINGMASVPDASSSFPAGQKQFSLSYVDNVTPLAPGVFPEAGVVELGQLQVQSFSAFATVKLISGEAVRSETLAALDMSDPGQSLASLQGDPMSDHALAVSICEEPIRGNQLTVLCSVEEEAGLPLGPALALLAGLAATAIRLRH